MVTVCFCTFTLKCLCPRSRSGFVWHQSIRNRIWLLKYKSGSTYHLLPRNIFTTSYVKLLYTNNRPQLRYGTQQENWRKLQKPAVFHAFNAWHIQLWILPLVFTSYGSRLMSPAQSTDIGLEASCDFLDPGCLPLSENIVWKSGNESGKTVLINFGS